MPSRFRTSWVWVVCKDYRCGRTQATPLVPWMIRWGVDDPGPLMETNFRCTACGKRGALLYCPNLDHKLMVIEAFPVDNPIRNAQGRRKRHWPWNYPPGRITAAMRDEFAFPEEWLNDPKMNEAG